MFRSTFVPALDPTSLAGSMADAATLLRGHGGLLQVHHVIDDYRPPATMADAVNVASIVEAQREAGAELEQSIKEVFDREAAKIGGDIVTGYDSSEGEMPRGAAARARAYALTVFRHRGEARKTLDSIFLEELLFHSGRPLLLLPEEGLSDVPRKIAVAWNGKREAARALSQAGPLLEDANAVRILSVGAAKPHQPGAEDMARVLSESGIEASALNEDAGSEPVARQLMRMAKDEGCDLLVLGAYSTSRLRETILGGVTRSVLERPPMPLLLAH